VCCVESCCMALTYYENGSSVCAYVCLVSLFHLFSDYCHRVILCGVCAYMCVLRALYACVCIHLSRSDPYVDCVGAFCSRCMCGFVCMWRVHEVSLCMCLYICVHIRSSGAMFACDVHTRNYSNSVHVRVHTCACVYLCAVHTSSYSVCASQYVRVLT
jgi:hypothetical protein